ncbi:hypothetical protein K7X08_035932 [Anisodus acutangulus]|uniref:Uncharacterized protein n=1 Tax=Anisodus acutangulus TaxID=402998 RepID=A0A9Q1L527_9SOLA|nr:hypothetical protein K7X08_035932 [Anisodus acutangulus]
MAFTSSVSDLHSEIASYIIPPMFEGITLMLDSSLQWCLSFNAFHAIPTMKFRENHVTAFADQSLVLKVKFKEVFGLSFSIFRTYDHSTLVYHCIPKSNDMVLISQTSEAHDNAFTELLAIVYARRGQFQYLLDYMVQCMRESASICQKLQGSCPGIDQQNQLTPYSIMWYFPEAFLLRTQSKSARIIACQDTFWRSICEFPIVLELIFVGEGYTQCVTSGALHHGLNLGVCWKGTKDDRTYSSCIDDNKKGCDCNPLEMRSACLVIQEVHDVVVHNLAALDANLFNWLVNQMHRDIALAIEASGHDFIWDATTDRDEHDNNMIFALFYSNLEDKGQLFLYRNGTKSWNRLLKAKKQKQKQKKTLLRRGRSSSI